MKKVVVAVAIGLVLVALIIAFGQIFTVRFVTVDFVNGVSSTDKQRILDLADINPNTNIFILDEKKIADKIQKGFEDNVIKVTDIVREFPNKVTIKVSERIALFRIKAITDKESGYVAADKNFQRTAVFSYEELKSEVLTDVIGFTVEGTYRRDECYALRDIADAFIECGIEEEALPYFICSIEFTETKIVIRLRTTDTTFTVPKSSDPAQSVKTLYEQYEKTEYYEREKQDFFI